MRPHLERIALLSDVHGNLTAPEAVLGDAAGMPELAGYAPELRHGIYRGSIEAGEPPTYHRRTPTPATP